ncbi:MAG TPA: metal-dependent hydrolase [Mycobacterium sp.]|nr:metal-dependent hydrolase [Mycobacterium sp.]
MTDLVIRKIPWEFEAGVPFNWQPANPNFSIFCNAFTFIAVPFEKYIIGSLRQAQEKLEDPDVAAEAAAFLRQEAQHAAAHRKHMLALIERYPALEGAYQGAVASYDRLIEEHPVEYHAAYVANLEATFTPLFKLVLDNRDSLFGGGDRRVASLMVWHFVEEIEHRSSGLILYRHLCDDPWYRTKRFRATFNHVAAVMAEIAKAFDEHVPPADRGGASAAELMSPKLLVGELATRGPVGRRRARRSAGQGTPPPLFASVPTSHLAKMAFRLALSQTPNHDPADQPLPEWADTWMQAYENGSDMTEFFGATAN